MANASFIKVCPDPNCEAVWHNTPKKETKCKDCGGSIMIINEATFYKKFSNNWFQYDYPTHEIYRLEKPVAQLELEFNPQNQQL